MTPKDLLTKFDRLHHQHLGVPAVIRGGKDAKLISGLARVQGSDMVQIIMEDYFLSDDPFIRENGYGIGFFISQAPKLIAKRARLMQRIEAFAQEVLTDWFDECKRLHQGRCNGRLAHHVQMQIDAAKNGSGAA